MRPPFEPSPAQGSKLLVRLAGLDLHRIGGVAAGLHPQSVDLVPAARREDLGQFGARDRLAPHADGLGDDLDVGMLGEDLLGRLGAQRVDRGAGHAGDDDDVALAVEPLDQPFGRHAAGLVLVDRDVVGAGLGDLGVVGEDQDALVAGVLDRLRSARSARSGRPRSPRRPACTMALICWIWRCALGPATWTWRSTLSAIDLCAAMALTMLAASACQSLPI